MNIVVDIDEVMANFLEQFIQFQEKKYGRTIQFENYTSYSLKDFFGVSEEEELKQIYEFYTTEFFKKIKPMPNSKESLEKLKGQGHRLFVVTARQNHIAKETINWVKIHYPNIFEDIIITNEGEKTASYEKKVDVCTTIGAEIIIEDSFKNASEAAREGMKAILFNKPWNQREQDCEGIFRVNSWEQALAVINSL